MEAHQISILAKTFCIGIGAFAGYVWGGWTVLMQVITFMIIADYLTGIIAGYVTGSLSSKVGFKGIAKKMAIFIFIAVGHFIDLALGMHSSMVMDSVITFYIGNELISIIENAGRMGFPVPTILTRAVEIFKNN